MYPYSEMSLHCVGLSDNRLVCSLRGTPLSKTIYGLALHGGVLQILYFTVFVLGLELLHRDEQ